MSDAKLRSGIRSNLRKIFRNYISRIFINSVRRDANGHGRYKYVVDCVECARVMGLSEKAHRVLKSGKLSKKERPVYEVDHINGNPPFKSMDDLQPYVNSLLFGELQILCVDCHGKKTYSKHPQPS